MRDAGLVIAHWFGKHTSLVATVTSGTVIAALVTTVAVVSGGYRAQQMDLGDAAVWVTSEARQLLGRANTDILRLNTAVPSTSGSLDVAQNGGTVLLVDKGNNTLDIIDPATSTVRKSVPLPPQNPGIDLAASRAAIVSGGTGQVWVLPPERLSDFSADSQPSLDLGTRALTAMDATGTLFAFSPTARRMYRIDAPGANRNQGTRSDTGAAVRATPTSGSQVHDTVSASVSVPTAADSHPDGLTTVNAHWALLDSTARKLYLEGRTVDLSRLLGSSTGAVLQQPSATGNTVYLASTTGLIGVPVDGRQPFRVGGLPVRGARDLGRPAAPTVVDGCLYAAWAGGTAWQRCDGQGPTGTGTGTPGTTTTASTLASVPANADLAFRVNGSRAVLNDSHSGATWAVQHGNALIDNWDDLSRKKTNQKRVEDNRNDTPPIYEKSQLPPVAVDDQLGARPGRANTLPVLLNDYDPNGDPLVISSVTAIPAAAGRLDLINNDQQVQLTLPPTAAGTISFGYTVTDGRGGSASATVTVTIRPPEENSPPRQVRTTKATVASGGRLSTQVLQDWYDPDGDPFFLTSAEVPAPDSVTSTPEGTVVYSDAGKAGLKDIALTVSDGRADGSGTLAVTVRDAGSERIIAEPFVVTAYGGHEVTISPLPHVRGGTGTLRLANVPAKPDSTITADYDAGTFRFSSDTVGDHNLEYAVTDGSQTVTGTVRVQVKAPPDANTPPITVPHTMFIHEQSTKNADVLATDIDPAGGVLLITGVSNVPEASGIRVEILQQRILRITLTRPLETGPIGFHYRVSNGLAAADGTVTVIQVPQPAVRQPPVANPDSVSVRVGDAITIPVLANDEQPDGDELTLDPVLAKPLPAGSGLLFASGNVLRYLAPAKAGNFTASYRVSAPDGQWATADVTISVRELDAATNNPPVPKTVVARVLAGDTVRIPIPLTGTDPDGDSVKLVGQETNPEKGAVTAVGADWIDYQAGNYSTGTDTFTYSVVDALGARATGTVRVGIAARLEGARNPVAVADEVTVRPGKSVLVQVLANDSDPDGGRLSITSVKPTGHAGTATVSGDVVRVTAPTEEGRYGFIYQIQNQRGGTSSTFLTVIVQKDAALARPLASDTVLTLADVLDRKSVDVDVLANVFFADGDARKLRLDVLPGYHDRAQVTRTKRIRIAIGATSQIIPFQVANPDDPSIVSYAFVWVPGHDDALPQLKPGAPKLTVVSGDTVSIPLADYVLAVGGRRVRLTDSSTVRATHANGANLVAGSDTLVFTSADRYFGPASISFQVTDGESATDPKGHVAALVLPITVTPRHNQPPVFTGASIDVEPGAAKTIDLLTLTSYPDKDRAQLRYTVLEPKPQGFTLSLSGTQLTIGAAETTTKGTRAAILIGIKDADNPGQAGRIDLGVVPSTRPIAIPQPDSAIAPRGQTTTVDVLANDNTTNPFPSVPLKVIAVRGTDSASLPKGVSITPSPDNSRLAVTVASDAAAIDTNLQYEVADATGDPDRYAWASVRISVQDRPEPVTNLHLTGFGDRQVTVAWNPGGFNNSPITGFDVTLRRPGTGEVVGTTICQTTTCTLATPGNGPDNTVSISVAARNGIGLSDPVVNADAVWSNIVPAAPGSISTKPLDHGLRVTWSKPADVSGASAITSYLVTVAGVASTVQVAPGDAAGTTYARNVTDPGISNGGSASVTVASRNDFYGAEPHWNAASASGIPAGAPVPTAAQAGVVTAADGHSATLSWPGVFDANGQAVTAYYAAVFTGDAPRCTVTSVADGAPQVHVSPNGTTFLEVGGDASAATFTSLAPNTSYRFLVYAYNGQGCTASGVAQATPRQTPGTPSSVATTGPEDGGQGLFDFRLTGVTYSSGGGYQSSVWNYRLTGNFGTETGQLPGSAGVLIGQTHHYGSALSVSVQVCETYTGGVQLCSGWSAPRPLGVAVSTQLGGLHFVPGTATVPSVFSWTSWPTGEYASVVYSCDGGGTTAPMPVSGAATCIVPGAVAGAGGAAGAALTVTVTANNAGYSRTYLGGNYE